ncbi:class I SAM-dependent methyltransferase [Candidatus Vampirococcus lugosii]|uniref:Type 11 methyltransferase n=1 Tax=Candidatus Vampirococcus lugosii TaxID=2789015 RepID=A0ABS5QMH0_9BACT|nr:class I SAM-dependent methyltransferase [Candidatus Vampirococcus lugosii]MBS8122405.1 type 11 methyltransferase [Candidatus Vampirococcus lugosii]
MGFYDNFSKGKNGSTTKIGKKTVDYRNNFFIKLIKQNIDKKDINILEIGPGKGFFAKKCLENNFNYKAIEGNKIMADNLKKNGIDVINDFVPPINIEQKFDVIFMNQVFEHMDNKYKAIELLDSCYERLNNGGIVLTATPDYKIFKEDFFICDYTHSLPTSINSLQQMFFDTGFKVIYKNYYTLFFQGFFLSRLTSYISIFLYNIGFLKLLFWNKSYKVKTSLLNSILLIGKKTNE